MNTKPVYALVSFVVILLVVHMIDYSKMNHLADYAKIHDMETGECFFDKDDIPFFGGIACVERNDNEKNTFIKYTVKNSYYEQVRIDVNKSRIIGNYLGGKSVEFMKGFSDGRKKTSKHSR